ncbi:hypothetical protein HPP92_013129 [Vanilla planifolia]|uniref:Uncharacterized protein n=1 Tax=Vanilla planifolia TaxID=51239 RepID=A0A835UWD1_VANPL|nr:hypothetical protein HPP92_013129 [Vanilla planifolia]
MMIAAFTFPSSPGIGRRTFLIQPRLPAPPSSSPSLSLSLSAFLSSACLHSGLQALRLMALRLHISLCEDLKIAISASSFGQMIKLKRNRQ